MTALAAHDVIREDRDGAICLRARTPLGPVVDRVTDWLDHWAGATPNAVFLAERSGPGWREVTYAAVRDEARALANGLLAADLGPDKPLMVLSGNSVDHGLLVLACYYAGVPIVPVAEQYAAIPAARSQLDQVAALTTPGAVWAEDGDALADALSREVFANALKLVSRGGNGTSLAELSRTRAELPEITADTVAKILLTSGSTAAPKGVLTSHRMMCTNQTQIAQCLPFLRRRPPVLVDWLPWNHVFGGSHNFNMALANGGCLYIDAGKPAPHLVGQTLENLRLKTGTIAFNVPVGFALLRDAMREDADLRRRYFEDLDMLFYAGASLPQDVWSDLEAMAREVRGDMPLFTSSWGLTETAPAALLQHQPTDRSGVVGVPLPGVEAKLVPDDAGRAEIRLRGPSIFEGYLADPDRTAAAFDAEGYFRTGDAMCFVDASRPNLGLRFDGRIGEDFKLSSGTWVRAANLRLEVLKALEGIARDVVICGEGRDGIGVLIVPLRRDAEEVDGALIVPDGPAEALRTITGGSSRRIARALVMAEPPEMAEGEITAKGNLNVARLLQRRQGLVDRLFDGGPGVIEI